MVVNAWRQERWIQKLVIGIAERTLMTGITHAAQDPLVDTVMDTAFLGKACSPTVKIDTGVLTLRCYVGETGYDQWRPCRMSKSLAKRYSSKSLVISQ